MKNTILLFVLLTMPALAFTQIQKGAGYFEGTLSGSYNNAENPQGSTMSTYTNNYSNFNISYGHYLTDRFAIGIGAGVNLNDNKNEFTGIDFYSYSKQTNTLYFVSPFIRTSKKIADNFFCFGNLNLMAGTGPIQNTSRSTYNDNGKIESTQVAFGARITGGLNYFLTRHFALTLSYGNLSYSKTTAEENDSDNNKKTTSEGLTVNLGLSSVAIGLQYFINNSEKK